MKGYWVKLFNVYDGYLKLFLIFNLDIFNVYNFNISLMIIVRKMKFNWLVRVFF